MWVLKNSSGFHIKIVPVQVEPEPNLPGPIWVWVWLPSLEMGDDIKNRESHQILVNKIFIH